MKSKKAGRSAIKRLEDICLRNWEMSQRNQYRLLQDPVKNATKLNEICGQYKLTEERIRKLDEIGFNWNGNEFSFNMLPDDFAPKKKKAKKAKTKKNKKNAVIAMTTYSRKGNKFKYM